MPGSRTLTVLPKAEQNESFSSVKVSLLGMLDKKTARKGGFLMERAMGVEPTSSPWKGDIIAIIRRPPSLAEVIYGGIQPTIVREGEVSYYMNHFCRGAEIRTRTTCSQSKRATITPRPDIFTMLKI